MKLIKLTQGKFAKVNNSDFSFLNQYKWCTVKTRNNIYYARTQNIRMQNLILHAFDW